MSEDLIGVTRFFLLWYKLFSKTSPAKTHQQMLKTSVHQQGLRTNQGPSAATGMTLMTHSLNNEASQQLCDYMLCLVEDGGPIFHPARHAKAVVDLTDLKGNPCVLIAFGTRD